ncbi:IS5 family transposase [Massilia varians]
MSRTDLTEKQWRKLEPYLPPNLRHGRIYVEHRHVINGILWRLRTGAPWRDIPSRYGPWQTCYDRFVRWSRNGTWQRLLKVMQAAADEAGLVDWDGAALDATHIKAKRSAAGARKTLSPAEKGGRNSRVAGSFTRRDNQQDPSLRRWARLAIVHPCHGWSVQRCRQRRAGP